MGAWKEIFEVTKNEQTERLLFTIKTADEMSSFYKRHIARSYSVPEKSIIMYILHDNEFAGFVCMIAFELTFTTVDTKNHLVRQISTDFDYEWAEKLTQGIFMDCVTDRFFSIRFAEYQWKAV